MTVALTGFLVAAPLEGNDWPYWRGPEQTGMSREKAAVTTWSLEGENLLWKVPVGGRTTPIVMGGRIFSITPVGEGLSLRERVICLDAQTGKTLWEQPFNVFDTDMVENRLGWTALVGDPETGNVYAHATGGEFFCFDRDGKLVWKWSMTEEFGRISGYGGRLHTPIIDEDRVIISFLSSSWGNQARPLHRYVAFDKKKGTVLWWAAPGETPLDTTYSVPVVAVIGGKRMLVAANADGSVYGMVARTGEKVWGFKLSKRGLNASVVVDGDHAFVSHSEENIDNTVMGRLVCIDATGQGDITTSGEVWRLDGCEAGYASPAIANGRLYVVTNSAALLCVDAKSGKVIWEHDLGRVGKGSPAVTSDGVIYVGEQNGIFHILRDAGEKCESLDVHEFTRTDGLVDEFFGSPAIAGGRVFFMTRYNTYCLGAKDRNAEPVTIPPMPAETASAEDKPGTLMVVPAELTVAPGEKAEFDIRLLSADTTQSSEPGSVEWRLTGPKGEVSADGTFTAAGESLFSAGLLTAKAGGVEGAARVRVCPKPPFEVDFENLAVDAVPPGWIGVARKTKVVERDGGKVLMKLAEDPSPPFMRIRPYFGPPIAGGFTITADVMGLPKGTRSRPDMGVVSTRYGLLLMGGARKLRIESWSSVPRVQHDLDFDWETEKWYRMKLQVKFDGDQGKISGKVWPRDEIEPQAWSIEFTDPYPNREGSPGLYGYSPGTTAKSKGEEIFYDNVKVTMNE